MGVRQLLRTLEVVQREGGGRPSVVVRSSPVVRLSAGRPSVVVRSSPVVRLSVGCPRAAGPSALEAGRAEALHRRSGRSSLVVPAVEGERRDTPEGREEQAGREAWCP